MRTGIATILITLSTVCFAQNLVHNGSFELHNKCPRYTSQLPYADGWIKPTDATPDYFDICTVSQAISVPRNTFGYQQAHTGIGYAGFFLYQYNYNYREYVSTKLKQTLTRGKHYKVKFYVSLANESEYATSDIEVLFTKEEIKDGTDGRLDFKPQLSYRDNKPVTDTLKWTEITWNYKAKGNEVYMTIGNFEKEKRCKIEHVPSVLPGTFLSAYYYLDDVCVEEIKDSLPCKCIEDTMNVRPTSPIVISKPAETPGDTSSGELDITPGQNIVLQHILFETNKSQLLPPSFPELDELVQYLTENADAKIDISGYTDSTGDEQKNILLSQARAKAVADYLISHSIDKARVSYKGYGSASPVASNRTTEGKAKNRRVEVKID